MWIFLDESGDLGFDFSKLGTSRFFTITLLICNSESAHKQIQKAVRRTLKNKVNAKRKKTYVQELKGTATSLEVKKYFLQKMPQNDWQILAITIDKKKVASHLQTKQGKKKLYNFLTRKVLDALPYSLKCAVTVNLIVDRCKDKEDRKDFDSYIQSNLETSFPLETRIYIRHENSSENSGLQAVDLFCWGIQHKENGSETVWYDTFSPYVLKHITYLYSSKKKQRNQHCQIPQTHRQPMEDSI